MSEYYFTAPTDDERNATYDGMPFDEFKQLDDKKVDALRLQLRKDWDTAYEQSAGDDTVWQTANETVQIFERFCKWRKHGVPDRDMTKEEFSQHMQHYANERRKSNPDYGRRPDRFKKLSATEQVVADWVIFITLSRGAAYDRQPCVFDTDRPKGGAKLKKLARKSALVERILPPSILFPRGSKDGWVLANDFADEVFARRWLPSADKQ